GLLVGQAGAVRIVDVPVDLAEVTLVFQADAERLAVIAGIEAPHAARDVDDLVDFLARNDAVDETVGQARAAEIADFLLLVGAEEEQAVLDDRATEGDAHRLVLVEQRVIPAAA